MKNACLSVDAMSGPPSAIAGLFIGSHIDFGLGSAYASSAVSNGNDCDAETAKTASDEKNNDKVDWLHIDMCAPTAPGKYALKIL